MNFTIPSLPPFNTKHIPLYIGGGIVALLVIAALTVALSGQQGLLKTTVRMGGYGLSVHPSGTIDPGTTVTVKYTALKTSRNWIGLYHQGASNEDYIVRRFTFDQEGSIPLRLINSGVYEVRYFKDITFDLVATAGPIIVRGDTAEQTAGGEQTAGRGQPQQCSYDLCKEVAQTQPQCTAPVVLVSCDDPRCNTGPCESSRSDTTPSQDQTITTPSGDTIITDEQDTVVCIQDVKQCPDGTYVERDPQNQCQFFPCPNEVQCPLGVKQCPDGSYVSPDPLNNCQYPSCPSGTAPITTTPTTPTPTQTQQPPAAAERPAIYSIAVTPERVQQGEYFTLIYTAPSGWNWIGIYRPGASNREYLDYAYYRGSGAARYNSNKLQPGTYEFRLFQGRSYDHIATSNTVRVLGEGQTTPVGTQQGQTAIPAGDDVVVNSRASGLTLIPSVLTHSQHVRFNYIFEADPGKRVQGVGERRNCQTGQWQFNLFMSPIPFANEGEHESGSISAPLYSCSSNPPTSRCDRPSQYRMRVSEQTIASGSEVNLGFSNIARVNPTGSCSGPDRGTYYAFVKPAKVRRGESVNIEYGGVFGGTSAIDYRVGRLIVILPNNTQRVLVPTHSLSYGVYPLTIQNSDPTGTWRVRHLGRKSSGPWRILANPKFIVQSGGGGDNYSVSVSPSTVNLGDQVTVTYSGPQGSYDQRAIMIRQPNNTPRYQANITSNSGSFTFSILNSYPTGTWKAQYVARMAGQPWQVLAQQTFTVQAGGGGGGGYSVSAPSSVLQGQTINVTYTLPQGEQDTYDFIQMRRSSDDKFMGAKALYYYSGSVPWTMNYSPGAYRFKYYSRDSSNGPRTLEATSGIMSITAGASAVDLSAPTTLFAPTAQQQEPTQLGVPPASQPKPSLLQRFWDYLTGPR